MMIADGVEAATRSLKNHSEGSLRNRVQAIVNRVVQDGQLEECPLTLKDLHTISETFVRVLLGIYHHRIEYPEMNPVSGDRQTPRARPSAAGPSITLEKPATALDAEVPHPLDSDGEWAHSDTGKDEGKSDSQGAEVSKSD